MTRIVSGTHQFEWHGTGAGLLEAMLEAVARAKASVRMETYIFSDEEIGRRFRQALVDAAARGVRVWLLVDAVGGMGLPRDYFKELSGQPAGAMKWFNEPSLATWSFRDHRKLLAVDGKAVFVGGCNIAEDYHGDGVEHGWRDGGMRVEGPVTRELEAEFDRQFATAQERQWKVLREAKKRRTLKAGATVQDVRALFIQPGFGNSPLRSAMRDDLQKARDICITSAYFLPSHSLRRQLGRAVRRGASLRLLVGGKSDVRLMQQATRSLYPRLLDAGIRIFEYLPQILHAKLMVIDNAVYVGSSNLDPRSLRINFEVMLRVECEALAQVARGQFEADLRLSEEVTPETVWDMAPWTRLRQHIARWVLGRLDPRLSESMLRSLKQRLKQ